MGARQEESHTHGKGKKYDLDNHLSYEGEFKSNQYKGKGTYYFLPDENGNTYKYIGEFAEGMYNGKGKMYLNNQLVYECDFVDNAYSGSGIYYFSQDEDGDVFRYEGECRDGTYNGKRKMFLNDQLGRAI